MILLGTPSHNCAVRYTTPLLSYSSQLITHTQSSPLFSNLTPIILSYSYTTRVVVSPPRTRANKCNSPPHTFVVARAPARAASPGRDDGRRVGHRR